MVQCENHWYVHHGKLASGCALDKELTLVIAFDAHRRRSPAYDHFNTTISFVPCQGNISAFFQYQYICKFGHAGCRITQKRNAPTDKLLSLMKTCNMHHKGQSLQPEPTMLHKVQTRYDPFQHCMLIAIQCAASN